MKKLKHNFWIAFDKIGGIYRPFIYYRKPYSQRLGNDIVFMDKVFTDNYFFIPFLSSYFYTEENFSRKLYYTFKKNPLNIKTFWLYEYSDYVHILCIYKANLQKIFINKNFFDVFYRILLPALDSCNNKNVFFDEAKEIKSNSIKVKKIYFYFYKNNKRIYL